MAVHSAGGVDRSRRRDADRHGSAARGSLAHLGEHRREAGRGISESSFGQRRSGGSGAHDAAAVDECGAHRRPADVGGQHE
ncbi:MAG: hypothetical protein QF664_05185 [Dehalococcoidia bacterium]|nr:hypothetical protein [Dehalococcoidia bacterium]